MSDFSLGIDCNIFSFWGTILVGLILHMPLAFSNQGFQFATSALCFLRAPHDCFKVNNKLPCVVLSYYWVLYKFAHASWRTKGREDSLKVCIHCKFKLVYENLFKT